MTFTLSDIYNHLMYINSRIHILSEAIMKTAALKVAAALSESFIRFILKKGTAFSPDMLDIMLWRSQLLISALQIILIVMLFYSSWKKLTRYINIVPEEDRKAMGSLQEEYFGEKISSLSVYSIRSLLELWAVIFTGAELLYCFTSMMYRKFAALMMLALFNGSILSGSIFVMLYNMTHGFKYLEILSSILLGVFITGIFLQDRILKFTSLSILLLFLLSFGMFEMQTVNIMGRDLGLVWTSVIYHISETAGLFLLSFYLSRHYKGL